MQFCFEMSDRAAADLEILDEAIKKRIVSKMRFFAAQVNPLIFAKHLTNSPYGEYRFRVGDYRILFDIDRKGVVIILVILRIKHRSEAYKKI